MFISYHLFFYAIGCLLFVMGMYAHPIFFIGLFIYCLWLLYRFNMLHLLIIVLLCIGLYFSNPLINEMPSTIEGKVIKVSENYCYVQCHFGTVKLYHDEDLSYGDTIKCEVEDYAMNNASNDNAFNEKTYLYSLKIFYKAKLTALISQTPHTSLYTIIESRFSSNQDVNDYQRLFLLGQRSSTIDEDYTSLSQLSLVHLFALSGMHVHILFSLLTQLFGFIFQKRLSKILSYLLLAVYIFSIPFNISLYRAFFVMFLYDLLKEWFNQLDVLSFLIIISLYYNPYIIFNITFIFSYFIYFIVLLTQNTKYSSLLIYLSSIPIVLYMNFQIPLITVIISSFLTPFIEIFYILCVASLFLSICEYLLHYCVIMFQSILTLLTDMNQFLILAKPNLSFIVIFYIIFFYILYLKDLRKPIHRYICILLSLILSFSLYSQYKIYGEITMIDVGQGDCTLIRLPMNQGNILVDTGGNVNYDLAVNVIIPYLKSIGINKLDYVYISHSDYDHCGALESLQENFQIDCVIDSYEAYREIGCMKVSMIQSDQVYTDANDLSLVMYVELPAFNVLFTGDASLTVEEDIADQLAELDVDILKVSHHGSSTATSTTLLSVIHPSIAMIGVGKNNLYGHPTDEVIERLERKGMTILRTDEDGMFHIRFYSKSYYVFR
ncbi:MAG: ComEC/Rec2 family competence protein [Erysipelotrichaceae bacterium]|nr:ComEC/Rec2 family competence protein [Erysipelotrichaceae bacterium]